MGYSPMLGTRLSARWSRVAQVEACCKAGSSSALRSPISDFCLPWRATATGRGPARASAEAGRWIYPLSLAVYCTSWTFFGSVGLSSAQGFDFLTIYIGPVLMIGLGYPLITEDPAAGEGAEHQLDRRLHRGAIRQEPDGRGDRDARRRHRRGALYRAATQGGLGVAPDHSRPATIRLGDFPIVGDLALVVAVTMAAFAVLFGTRHIDATEHQEGLMLAIATESLIKLVAFLVVGMLRHLLPVRWPAATSSPRPPSSGNILPIFTSGINPATWLTMTVLSLARDRAAAASVPRHRRREQRRGSTARRASGCFRFISCSSICSWCRSRSRA